MFLYKGVLNALICNTQQVSVDVRENVATIISSLGLAVYDMLGSLEGCHFHVLNLPCS